jgi:hypothetical protein
MALDTLRLVERVHGHLGWLVVAALAHPALLLRRPRKAHLAVGFATSFATLTAALGLWLYGPYRDHLKRQIFIEAPWIGLLFERKEHLAFGAVLLAWAGCVAYVAARKATTETASILSTTAFRAYVASSILALVVAALGTYVAVYKSF